MSGEQELDSLTGLEERITRAVELVSALKAENARLEAELRKALAGRDGERKELDDLRAERKQVRARVEKLIGQLDLLKGS